MIEVYRKPTVMKSAEISKKHLSQSLGLKSEDELAKELDDKFEDMSKEFRKKYSWEKAKEKGIPYRRWKRALEHANERMVLKFDDPDKEMFLLFRDIGRGEPFKELIVDDEMEHNTANEILGEHGEKVPVEEKRTERQLLAQLVDQGGLSNKNIPEVIGVLRENGVDDEVILTLVEKMSKSKKTAKTIDFPNPTKRLSRPA